MQVCARVTRSYGPARTRLWCKIMSGLNVARYNRGLQFCDVRVLQSDLEFVDYHRRSTRELMKRRGENMNEQDPHLLPEITAWHVDKENLVNQKLKNLTQFTSATCDNSKRLRIVIQTNLSSRLINNL